MILFLAANPAGTHRLALDREARSIHVELKRSGYRDRFEFVTRWAAEPLDLLREVRELKPTVVHFSGHSGAREAGARSSSWARDVVIESAPAGVAPPSLYFHDSNGGTQVVSPEAIAQTLGAAGASVKLVVLNACFTEPIAQSLLAHVDCVVGVTGSIHDDAARTFAIGFYGGLGEHESVAAAFAQGKAAIRLDGLPDADRPQLRTRDGFEATGLILAAVAPSVRVAVSCPYPGMRPYAADDAAGFRGREAELQELLGRLRAGERELYVIGPSGSGKSSLVAAGLLPRIARGVAGMGPFVVRDLRPGEQPAARLRQALEAPPEQPFDAGDRIAALLVHRGPGSLVLLVVDQLEELFTLASPSEREAFLAALRVLRAERRCVVIFTLRADFFGALMESALWTEHRGHLSRIEVSPLRGNALREAIAAPARDVGVAVEPELTERLLADAASEPGILPLLQETMVQLWDVRVDQTLTLADYESLGDGDRSGLAVSLSRRADATLRRFTPAQTAIARRILLRLISFGEGRSDTRRQQPRANLCATADDAADFAYVLQEMIDDRLLTTDDDDDGGEAQVDLGHEIMITAWPALANWIRTYRVDEQRRRRFEAAAAHWVEHGRGGRGLLDPIELADAEMWQQAESTLQFGHSADAIGLIAASRAVHAKQRRHRRLLIGGAFATLAAFVVIVATLAIVARRKANDAKHLLALSYMESGRQLLVDGHPQESIPYLLAARQNGIDSPPLRMMFFAVARHLPLIPALEHSAPVHSAGFSSDGTRVLTASWGAQVWDVATGNPIVGPLNHHCLMGDNVTGNPVTGRPKYDECPIWTAAFSPDGTQIVTTGWDGTAQVWNASTGKPLGDPLKHQASSLSAAFSPDSTRVVTASDDKTARVWDAATGKPITGPLVHRHSVSSAAFSPDGTRVVTASRDRTARVWDAATGQPLTPSLEHQAEVVSAAFSPDGTRVVTASKDKTARVWDAATGQRLVGPLEHQAEVVSAAFSPDGTRIVTASRDKTARVWNAVTGEPLIWHLEHQAAVVSAAFSPDGTRIVTASADSTARVWDAATGQPVTSTLEHQAPVVSAAFSPDGTRIVTASEDTTARVWDAATGRNFTRVATHQDRVMSAAFSPDATRVVTASEDKTARVWDAATGKPLTIPLEHQGAVRSAAFSPDGTRVVTASEDGTARVWDAATGEVAARPLQHQRAVVSARFSPDGTRVVTGSEDKTARVWNVATGMPLTMPLKHQAAVVSAAFSPDGTRVITASMDEDARVWNVATGTDLYGRLPHGAPVASAAFSPNGTLVVTASWDRTARVHDSATGAPLSGHFEHQAAVVSAAFSPDSTRIVTASWDRTAQIWDVATGTPVTNHLEHQAEVVSAEFSSDGTRVVTASRDKTARVWDAVTGKPLTSPLEHQDWVTSAAFSPDGTRVVTGSADKTARVWDVRLDGGTLQQWSAVAKRSPFVLHDGVLVHSTSRVSEPGTFEVEDASIARRVRGTLR